jgi:hypothetical protein
MGGILAAAAAFANENEKTSRRGGNGRERERTPKGFSPPLLDVFRGG